MPNHEAYKYLIQVKNGKDIYYYNSAMYSLESNPNNASKYLHKHTNPKHMEHAGSMGGKVSVTTYDKALKKLLKQSSKSTYNVRDDRRMDDNQNSFN